MIDNTQTDFILQPKDEEIEEYFSGLKGFERQLLTRKSKPLYTNRFITPLEYNMGYVYYKRTYTWPSDDYCIDITSPSYFDFISSLNKMAQTYDELWTDNMWGRMTHEAIKNYDWTYTREFIDGEEEDNVVGGERMHKVINIIGRVFDDIKNKIDTIKSNNKVTYNGDRNIPNALLSDKLELKGWDIYSVIPNYEEDGKLVSADTLNLDDTFFEKINDNEVGTPFEDINAIRWYDSLNNNEMTFGDADNEFMRRLLLSTNRIFETKGTRHSIDMVMGMFGYGEDDYTIIEEFRKTTPKRYDEYKADDGSLDFGDEIVTLNNYKENGKLYDEDASGIPVGSFTMSDVTANLPEEGEEEQEKQYTVNYSTYLIPFYNQNKIYDGDIYFQNNGGWCYDGQINDTTLNPYNWNETVSYLHVVPNIGALLNVNPVGIEEGDIYYVSSLSDYMDYSEEVKILKSNFFVLMNRYTPELLESWTNISFEEDAYIGEDPVNEALRGYAEKAKYLNDIIPYNLGNNPHVGFGYYDGGKEFYEYMRKPFKYAIDNYFFNIEEEERANDVRFYVSDAYRTGYGKLLSEGDTPQSDNSYVLTFYEKQLNDFITKEEYNELEDKEGYIEIKYEILTENEYDELDEEKKEGYEKLDKIIIFANEKKQECIVDIVSKKRTDLNVDEENPEEPTSTDDTPSSSTSGDAQQVDEDPTQQGGETTTDTTQEDEGQTGTNSWGNMRYASYDLNSIDELAKNTYYLNSKVIHLRNNIENNEYRKYFKNVIIKYLLQVIPSTAILLLENFEETIEDDNKHLVHFLDADETTQLYPDQIVEDGGTAENPNENLEWHEING